MGTWICRYRFLAKDPVVTLGPKSFDNAEVLKLSKREKWSIEELKRLSGNHPNN